MDGLRTKTSGLRRHFKIPRSDSSVIAQALVNHNQIQTADSVAQHSLVVAPRTRLEASDQDFGVQRLNFFIISFRALPLRTIFASEKLTWPPLLGTGFGSNTSNNSAFGQNRPAFGAANSTSSGGGGLFGGGTTTTGTSGGFGGFGNNNNNASGGGIFGQSAQKPAFGSGTSSGGLFGSGNTSGGFGQTNNQTSSAFGAPMSSALGQNSNAECTGTGSTPFSAYTEKEGPASNTTNHFQSISFMPPYQKFSFEASNELRLADYNAGRRFGNSSGQAGAFGQTNFGGGFGQGTSAFGQPQNNTGGGLFGQPAATSAPAFGGTQTASSGFGGGGGGLFGQNKPAGSSLFGGTTSSSGTTGGLFGTTNNAGGGFGGGTNNSSSGFGTGGGLFGQNNTQQQSKPLFGNSTSAPSGGFGTGSSGFGGGNTNTNSGGGLFGGTQSNQFGQPQQQQQNQNPFGGFGQTQNQSNNSSSAFGGFGQPQQQEQKPGGLFSNQNSTSGGGLFGNLGNNNNQQQVTSGGLFGQSQNNNQAQTSSLFNKPATTGGLFGNSNTNTNTPNTGGGLFGGFNNNNTANQNQQNQGGLFGNNNNQQQKPGLFTNTQSSTGGGLFGNLGNNNNNQQQGGSSLFGTNNQQQQPSGGLFGATNNSQGSSILGSQQQQQQPNVFAPPPALSNSLVDPGSAYGSPSIFSGLPPPPMHVGPLATPINVKQKMKKSTIIPQYKINPNVGSRMVTPQKRGGFGFSYSTYGTPGSASSNASTPGGLSSSLLYGSVGRGLGKSLSTSNLRRTFDSDSESILTPGAFSAGSSRYGGAGSLKRLTIDRSLRTDLFGDRSTSALPSPEKTDQSKQPGILKKKVSFDASTVGGNGKQPDSVIINGSSEGNGSDKENSATPSAEEQGFIRTPSRLQRGLGTVVNGVLQQPEMEQVPRGNELAIVHEDEPEALTGQANRGPPQSQEDQQPGNYWMKPSDAEINKMSQDEKRKVKNFSVGREGCGRVDFDTPVDLSLAPLSDIFVKTVLIELRSITVYPDQTKKPPQGKGLNVPSTLYLENSWPRQRDRRTPLHEKSGPRFQKHIDRLRKVGGTEFVRYEKDTGIWVFKVPHFTTYGFDYDDDDATEGESLSASVQKDALDSSILSDPPDTPTPKFRPTRSDHTPAATNSTLRSFATTNESSLLSSSPEDTFQFHKKRLNPPGAFNEDMALGEESMLDDDHEMQEANNTENSFLGDRSAISPSDSGEDEPSEMHEMNGALQDRGLVIHDEDNPTDLEMAGAFPLLEVEEVVPGFREYGTPSKNTFNVDGDWAQELQRTISPRKQDRQALRETQARAFEEKGTDQKTSVFRKKTGTPRLETSIDLMNSLYGQEQARRHGRNAKQVTNGSGFKLTPGTLQHQRAYTDFALHQDIPMAKSKQKPFKDMATLVQSGSVYERYVWELASILFDHQNMEGYNIPNDKKAIYEHRVRKDRLIALWEGLCQDSAKAAVSTAGTAEERAIAHLSAHKVVEACDALVQGKDFRLAILVAQLGPDETMRADMEAQIAAWRDLNVLSEMTEPIRAIYSLLSGNTCVCEGKKGPPEDRARTFVISENFNLDWKRAFGLRLFYAILPEEPIEAAVVKFASDLQADEGKKPTPWFIEEGSSELPWQDPNPSQREDILWGLLELYAASKSAIPTPSIAETFAPQNTTGNPLDTRLSFQLYHALTCCFPSVPASAPFQADALAWDFATQLDSAGEWLWAMFALLHLSSPQQRQMAIQSLLAHHTADISTSPANDAFKTLTQEFKIPAPWIYEAKALYARTLEKNHVQEVHYLLQAGDWDEAHAVLKKEVGPTAVIEEDWNTLRTVLYAFKPRKDGMQEWGLGGQVYEDYLDLIAGNQDAGEKKESLGRLLGALPMMAKGAGIGFRERVAVQEISAVVGREVMGLREEYDKGRSLTYMVTKGEDKSRVLQLPLADDRYLKHTQELSLQYYKAVMAR
ncbi:hypothetical protein ACLMJK_005335 [Lecanora helva]